MMNINAIFNGIMCYKNLSFSFFLKGDSQSGGEKEETNSKETLEEKREESGFPQGQLSYDFLVICFH